MDISLPYCPYRTMAQDDYGSIISRVDGAYEMLSATQQSKSINEHQVD